MEIIRRTEVTAFVNEEADVRSRRRPSTSGMPMLPSGHAGSKCRLTWRRFVPYVLSHAHRHPYVRRASTNSTRSSHSACSTALKADVARNPCCPGATPLPR